MVLDPLRLNNRWLAVHVRTGREISIACSLTLRGYEQFVPCYPRLRRWSDRTTTIRSPFFPGYVFLRFDSGNRCAIVTIPGVIGFVGTGKDPVPIEDSEIEALRMIADRALAFGPCQFLRIGETVQIQEGPLSGLRGIVLRFKGKTRLVVSVALLKQSVYVEIESSCATRTSASEERTEAA
jgi:transcription termination/antitermination protein NusG